MFFTILFFGFHVLISDLEALCTDSDVLVAGEDIDVLGATAVEASLPTAGNVAFTGKLKASGSVRILATTGPGFQKPISASFSVPSFTSPTLGTNFYLPSTTPIISIPNYKAPNYALAIFAPIALELLSRIRNSGPRLRQMSNPNELPFKRSLFIPVKAAFDPDISNIRKVPLINAFDCEELVQNLPDIGEVLPDCNESFIDTGCLLPVSGRVSITARF